MTEKAKKIYYEPNTAKQDDFSKLTLLFYDKKRMFGKSYNLVTKGYFIKKILDFRGEVV